MTKSLKVVVPSVHMKPSMAYSTEIASQKMENFIHQQYEKSTKKMDDVLNHVMINECPYKWTTTHSNCTNLMDIASLH
jgi:hypothetical protein